MADFMNIAKSLIAKVENKLYGEGSAQADGKISTAEENSIFNSELAQAVKNGELSENDADAIKNTFGLEASGPAKAKKSDGADVTVVINNDINININISVDVQNILDDFLKNFDLNALIEKLIAAMQDNTKAFEEFLVGILNKFADDMGLDLGNIQDLLKQIIDKLKEQGVKIDNLNESVNKLILQNLEMYQGLGLNIQTLIDLVKQNNESQEEQNEKLTLILDAIKELTNSMHSMSADLKANFNTIVGLLQSGNAKLDDVLALLRAIKEDTSENNQISKEILEYIKNLQITGGGGDVDVSGIAAQLQAILNAIKEGNAKQDDILATLKLINANVEKYGKENSEWLQKIYDKLDKIDENTSKFLNLILTAVNNLKNGIDVDLQKLLDKLDEILQAIQDHEVHVTVDVNCHCHCEGGDDPNEGIKNDMSGLLSNLGISFDWNEADSIQGVSADKKADAGRKFVDTDGRVAIKKGNQVFNLDGTLKRVEE